MTGFHEIIVSERASQVRVSVAPRLPLDRPDRTFADRPQAMAYARLLWLQHGFAIVELGKVAQ